MPTGCGSSSSTGRERSCTRWIRETLGDRPHLAVALDRAGQGLDATLDSVANLVAASVPIDHRGLESRLAMAPGRSSQEVDDDAKKRTIRLSARTPPLQLPPFERASVTHASARRNLSEPALSHAEPAREVDGPVIMAPPPPLPAALGQAALRSLAAGPRIAPSLDGERRDGMPLTGTVAVSPLAATLETLSATHRQVVSRLAELHQRYLAAHSNGLPVGDVEGLGVPSPGAERVV